MTAAERLARSFIADHPDDAAQLLERAEPADAAMILEGVPASVAAEVYRALGPGPAAACAALLGEESLAAIIEALPVDAAGAALRRVVPTRRDSVLERLEEDRRDLLRALLSYPEDTAGALADPQVLAFTDDITAGEAQRQLRGAAEGLFDSLYVVTRERALAGVLSLSELLAAPAKVPLASVMRRDLVRLEAHADLATVAAHPAWRDFDALPVVDGAGRLIGVIRHKTIRRMSREPVQPMMDTIVGLSELYWVGLAGMLASLAPPRALEKKEDRS